LAESVELCLIRRGTGDAHSSVEVLLACDSKRMKREREKVL
jgi:hypothetical protein